MTPFTVFRRFDNYVLAHIVKSKLEAGGIHCLLKDANAFAAWSGALGQIQLLVPEAEQLAAEEILISDELALDEEREKPGFWDEDDAQLDPNNHICIYCGSKNTRRLEDEKDTPFLSWLLSRFTKESLNSSVWHCFHCGKDF